MGLDALESVNPCDEFMRISESARKITNRLKCNKKYGKQDSLMMFLLQFCGPTNDVEIEIPRRRKQKNLYPSSLSRNALTNEGVLDYLFPVSFLQS